MCVNLKGFGRYWSLPSPVHPEFAWKDSKRTGGVHAETLTGGLPSTSTEWCFLDQLDRRTYVVKHAEYVKLVVLLYVARNV